MVATPVRMCASCRRRAPKDHLVRLVVAAGRIVPDLPATHPGRGAHLCRERTCLDRALRGDAGLLRRALRSPSAMIDAAALGAAIDSSTTTRMKTTGTITVPVTGATE